MEKGELCVEIINLCKYYLFKLQELQTELQLHSVLVANEMEEKDFFVCSWEASAGKGGANAELSEHIGGGNKHE